MIKYIFLMITLFQCAVSQANSAFNVSTDLKHDISPSLRELPALVESSLLPESSRSIIPVMSVEHTRNLLDPAIQTTDRLPFAISVNSFPGIGIGLGNYQVHFTPPDANGSVGLTQYVQWVNTDFAVFTKSTGTVVSGFPKAGNSIWAGFGGLCESTNKGEPIVKYDQLANRWVLTQSAFLDPQIGPFFQCVAVSTSSDATGSYYRYAFSMDSFNDYAKLGLWSDAYYMSFNMFGPKSNGPRACALDRNNMLSGKIATIQCFQISFNQSGTLLPADLDGKTKPFPGTPEYFMSFKSPNSLLLFKFHVDFSHPNNSTFSGPANIPVANFAIACANSAGASCAPQPNTSTLLDTVSDRLMHRLAYRQFNDHGAMVATHTVKGPGPESAPAIRWYELRFPIESTNPSVFQQATYAPDALSRYMGSIAIDKFGNIAVGYTISSANASGFPSVAFSARNAGDPLNVLSPSQFIIKGSGSQLNNISGWGSYSAMAIDPSDDCTFWYTNEYLKKSGSFNWSTQIGYFKLNNC